MVVEQAERVLGPGRALDVQAATRSINTISHYYTIYHYLLGLVLLYLDVPPLVVFLKSQELLTKFVFVLVQQAHVLGRYPKAHRLLLQLGLALPLFIQRGVLQLWLGNS